MSGALPTTQAPSGASLRSVQPSRVSVSHSLKRQVRTVNTQRWTMALSWESLTRPVWAELQGFLLSQRGQAETFTVTVPGLTTPLGTWLGSPVVNGAGQTGRSINLSGFTINQAKAVRAGDFLKFAGHTKVYMATADAASNASGLATVSIDPVLMVSPGASEVVSSGNIPFTVALASDNLDTSFSLGPNYSLQLDLVEVY
jgi:hypothetical protein